VFDPKEPHGAVDLWRRPAAQDAWVRMWTATATRYRDSSNIVGYDLMVEPLLDPEVRATAAKPAMWYGLARRLVTAIRHVDGATPILVSVAPQGNPAALGTIPAGMFNAAQEKLVFTIHQYEPYDEYTHLPASGSEFSCTPLPPPTLHVDSPRPLPAGVAEQLNHVYDRLEKQKDSLGVPVAVNELGVMRWEPGAEQFMQIQVRRLEQLRANYAVWVWDPKECLGWDEMNFRNGPDPRNHHEFRENLLATAIREGWRRPARP
jgi:hypothetical protein